MVPLERRDFLRFSALSVIMLALYDILSTKHGERRLVRPPGSVTEDSFLGVCMRCGACAKICPTGAILLAAWDDGFREIGTPKIDALRGPCERIQGRCEKDAQCQLVCPTKAIQKVEAGNIKTGSAMITRDRCIAWRGGLCLVCYEVCPVAGAISLERENQPVFGDDVCVGCGRCLYACPAQPKALTLTSIGEKRPRIG
jgi:ferredoxin-type protein NapG